MGRLVSYSIYVAAASAASASLGSSGRDSLGSPLGVAMQLLMLGGLVLLVRVDWRRVVPSGGRGPTHRPPAHSGVTT